MKEILALGWHTSENNVTLPHTDTYSQLIQDTITVGNMPQSKLYYFMYAHCFILYACLLKNIKKVKEGFDRKRV